MSQRDYVVVTTQSYCNSTTANNTIATVPLQQHHCNSTTATASATLAAPCRLRLNRRFIVVEGISQNLGDIAPLDQIYKLKEKFKYRLVLDESLSFGVLGATGKGAAEHFGLRSGQVEIVAASMGERIDHDLASRCTEL